MIDSYDKTNYFLLLRLEYDLSGNLYFSDMRRADEGNYTCVAQNSAGVGTATVSLHYIGTPAQK